MSNTRKNDFQRVEKRRKEAAERIIARLLRSSNQQIKALDDRLGTSLGATRERARLAKG